MSRQETKLRSFYNKLFEYFSFNFVGPWRIRSTGLISVLIGYYFASVIISYLINTNFEKVFVLIIFLIYTEFSIRIRTKIVSSEMKIFLYILDNLRLGSTYAVVLEAFKLGS